MAGTVLSPEQLQASATKVRGIESDMTATVGQLKHLAEDLTSGKIFKGDAANTFISVKVDIDKQANALLGHLQDMGQMISDNMQKYVGSDTDLKSKITAAMSADNTGLTART